MHDQVKGGESSADGIQGLQGFAEVRHPRYLAARQQRKRYLSIGQPQKNMGLLQLNTKETQQHVLISRTIVPYMQNRPFHIKEGKVEELDKTATNIIISTLFLENSVSEYEILYFK